MDKEPSYGNISNGSGHSRHSSIGEEYAEYNLEDQIIDESTRNSPSVQSKPQKKFVQDIYDEDNYTLARDSDDQTNVTSKESQKANNTKELRELEKTITTKNKIIIGLAVGIFVLSVTLGVCTYLAVPKMVISKTL